MAGRLRVLAGAGATLAVAGCGSVSGSGPAAHPAAPPAIPRTLCAAAGDVDSLVVSRDVAFPADHLRFTFPPRVVITSPPRARAVAAAVCRLPRAPEGIFSCPVDLGLSYRLAFSAAGRRFPVVTVDAGGCRDVTGAGPQRWLAGSSFWAVLGRAAGVADPQAAFPGCPGQAGSPCPKNATYTA